MAYLGDTVVPNYSEVALTGSIMRNDDTSGWTKHPWRIDWSVIVRRWAGQPTIADLRRVKARLLVAPRTRADPARTGGRRPLSILVILDTDTRRQ